MIADYMSSMTLARTKTTSSSKKKQSLSAWAKFQTVDWQADAKREYDRNKELLHDPNATWIAKVRYEIGSWLIPAVVGVLTATSGDFIEKTVEWLGDLRSG